MKNPLDSLCRPVRSASGLSGRCVWQWWPQLVALATTAAVISVVISGSLGVGDAIQHGLQRMSSQRLGGIVAAVVGQEPFQKEFSERLSSSLRKEVSSDVPGCGTNLVPVIFTEITVERPMRIGQSRASTGATLLGCDQPSDLHFDIPTTNSKGVQLSQRVVDLLNVQVGESVVLRVTERSGVPSDLPLGRRQGASRSRRVVLVGILPSGSVGDFSLSATEPPAGVALVSLALAEQLLDWPDKRNGVFFVGRSCALSLVGQLSRYLAPSLADIGLSFEPSLFGGGLGLTSRRLVLEPAVDAAAEHELRGFGGVPSLVFLANEIYQESGTPAGSVPYSTVLGIEDTTHPAGDLVDMNGELLAKPIGDEVIINRWLADDLAAQGNPVSIGDKLIVRSFIPETIHGNVTEQVHHSRVCGIAEMSGLAISQDVVPTVEGVTDEESIADWDPPFPFERERVRTTAPHDEDDKYWKQYKASPKIFMPLQRARDIAGSRFGQTTAWHLPPVSAEKQHELGRKLAAGIPPESVGLRVLPLGTLANNAAKGSTPFGILFLTLSSFLLVAAVILLWLCFGLLVTSQHQTLGVLAAIGWRPRQVATLLASVAGIPIGIGICVGAVISPLWSEILLLQLRQAWIQKIGGETARIFSFGTINASTLLVGAILTGSIAMAAVYTAALRTGCQPPLRLLRGSGFGLTGLPFWCRPNRVIRSFVGLAIRNILRRPIRSLAVVLMVALAEFLVVFVSGFELVESVSWEETDSPTGGWTYIAQFAFPTSVDPSIAATNYLLNLSEQESALLGKSTVALLRANEGDDANCASLFATKNPRVVGLSDAFLERGGFRFAGHVDMLERHKNPWQILRSTEWDAAEIPIIVDAATSQWALKLGGVGSVIRLNTVTGEVWKDDSSDTNPVEVQCRIVGLLEPSILQGMILMSEANFVKLFPFQSGYRMAFVDTPVKLQGDTDVEGMPQAEQAIAAAWGDFGVRVEAASNRLQRLFAVQNTFLAGFQSLGTIGLLLGTVGVAAVGIQGVLERRNTLAILLAIGFNQNRLGFVLWLESMILVLIGIVIGGFGGFLAAFPFINSTEQVLPWGWLLVSAGGTLVAATIASLCVVLCMPVAKLPVSE